jgi:DNA-3-methyladenine glycosylase I
MSTTFKGPDGQERCRWSGSAPEFLSYHDSEWGFPVDDDRRLFEKLCLESFQSGLSWRTILAKREKFRAAFDNFDFNKIAQFTQKDIDRLLGDVGIVRHRGKIEATINNAGKAKEMVNQYGSLAAFFWRYEPTAETLAEPQTASTSAQSTKLSKDLKKMG